MTRSLVIFDFAYSIPLNFVIYEENFLFFFISVGWVSEALKVAQTRVVSEATIDRAKKHKSVTTKTSKKHVQKSAKQQIFHIGGMAGKEIF